MMTRWATLRRIVAILVIALSIGFFTMALWIGIDAHFKRAVARAVAIQVSMRQPQLVGVPTMQQGDCFVFRRGEGTRASVVLRREAYRVLFLHDDGTEEWRDIDDLRAWFPHPYTGRPDVQFPGSEDDIRRDFANIMRTVRARQERLQKRSMTTEPLREERTRVIDLRD